MKTWLVALALVCCGVKANASVEMRSELLSDCTSFSVTVASAPAVQLLSASVSGATTSFLKLMENRTLFEIQNTTDVAAADMLVVIGLSSTSTAGDTALTVPTALSVTSGRLIGPEESWSVPLAARNGAGRVLVPWAVNRSGAGSVNAIVTQCKP